MSTTIDGRLFVKISDLEPGTNFSSTDEFVFVQNGTTLKLSGQDVTDSVVELGNLASKAYVDAIVAGAPDLLNTLDELAAALNDDANFGATITNLINEKLPISNFGLEFWNQLATVNTYHIQEGSNLYWTQERFDAALAAKNTYHLAEGSNLYFTEQRVLDVVEPLIPTVPTDVNQLSDVDGLLAGGVGNDPTFASVTTSQLNVQNVAFTGTGAVTITSGNDLNLVAAGRVLINGETFISLEDLKSVVALSSDFADFKNRIAGI